MNKAERWLKVSLFLFGFPAAMAVIPFVMPWSWMAATHEWLGMGVLPEKPVIDYLARYASAFSAFYGILLLLLLTDVRRYAPIITFQAVAILAISTVGAVLAYRAGMPTWWVLGDVFSCWLFCGSMLWLQIGIRPA